MSTATDVLRSEQINLKLAPEELARLRRLAEHLGVSEQNVLRLLIKRAGDDFERTGHWPPTPGSAAPAAAARPRTSRRARK